MDWKQRSVITLSIYDLNEYNFRCYRIIVLLLCTVRFREQIECIGTYRVVAVKWWWHARFWLRNSAENLKLTRWRMRLQNTIMKMKVLCTIFNDDIHSDFTLECILYYNIQYVIWSKRETLWLISHLSITRKRESIRKNKKQWTLRKYFDVQ